MAIGRELLEEAAAQRRLAGADLAGQQHDAATAEAVAQVRQRLAMALAQVQIARIGRDRERLALESEMLRVHGTRIPARHCYARSHRTRPNDDALPHRLQVAHDSADRGGTWTRTGPADSQHAGLQWRRRDLHERRRMLAIVRCLAGGQGLAAVLVRRAPSVTLDWDLRQRSRFEATDSSGRRLGVFLPRGSVVRGGDVLVARRRNAGARRRSRAAGDGRDALRRPWFSVRPAAGRLPPRQPAYRAPAAARPPAARA